MSKVKLVSIIVPIYNVEKYLRKCIDSILAQTYTNYELLLIDDGSPDSCGEICKEYLGDARVSYFRKENGGLSDARNFGLSKATGSHVMFADSDDYLNPECLQTLVGLIKDDVDVACVGSCYVAEDEERSIGSQRDTPRGEMDGKTALKCLCIRKHFGTAAWGKLYDINLLKDVRFPVGIIHEDIWTVPYILDSARKVAYEDSEQYFYVQRNTSIMHKPLSDASYNGFKGLNRLVSYIDEKYPDLHDAALCRWISDFFGTIMNRLVFQDDYNEKAKNLRAENKAYFEGWLSNPYLSRVKKVQCFFFLHSLPVLRILMKVYIREFKENA